VKEIGTEDSVTGMLQLLRSKVIVTRKCVRRNALLFNPLLRATSARRFVDRHFPIGRFTSRCNRNDTVVLDALFAVRTCASLSPLCKTQRNDDPTVAGTVAEARELLDCAGWKGVCTMRQFDLAHHKELCLRRATFTQADCMPRRSSSGVFCYDNGAFSTACQMRHAKHERLKTPHMRRLYPPVYVVDEKDCTSHKSAAPLLLFL